mgnify:CR=1 FL=1
MNFWIHTFKIKMSLKSLMNQVCDRNILKSSLGNASSKKNWASFLKQLAAEAKQPITYFSQVRQD